MSTLDLLILICLLALASLGFVCSSHTRVVLSGVGVPRCASVVPELSTCCGRGTAGLLAQGSLDSVVGS